MRSVRNRRVRQKLSLVMEVVVNFVLPWLAQSTASQHSSEKGDRLKLFLEKPGFVRCMCSGAGQ
jgi:hypothetical protein